MEIVLYTRKYLGLLDGLASIDLDRSTKDRKVTNESLGVVIDGDASTFEAPSPHVSIGRGVVDLGRVTLKQLRDIVFSGSS